MRAARNAENRAVAQLAEARRELEDKELQLGGLTGRAQVERVLSLRSRVAELEQQLTAVSAWLPLVTVVVFCLGVSGTECDDRMSLETKFD